jgi:FixJ family two-component response regulator
MYSSACVSGLRNLGGLDGIPAHNPDGTRPAGGSVLQTRMISIVDDDAPIREAIRGLVRSLGYNAAAFGSAEAFLESEQLHDTSCLITDVQMPGLSGPDLQDHLIARGHRMPVIFVTAHAEERIRTRVLGAGAVGFFSKPFDTESLIACLDRAVSTHVGPAFA